MELISAFATANLFTLLCAPVAKGKTKAIVDFYQQSDASIIYLSPLRALANEVRDNLVKRDYKNVYLLGNGEPKNTSMEAFLKKEKAFLVATAELLDDDFLEEIVARKKKVLVVIDEFHLFYYWGEEFRPILLDKIFSLLFLEFPVLGITATLDESILEKLKKDLVFHQAHWVYLDYGNQKLTYNPEKITSFAGLSAGYLKRSFWRELKHKKEDEILLYFCAYRSSVDDGVAMAQRLGYRSLGCVGGEVDKFQSALLECEEQRKKIDCIFATTALSHGVNLPEIKKVFIEYEVKNYDFWVQMIGRGGRRGSPYRVYTCDAYETQKTQRFWQKIHIWLEDFIGVPLEL